MKAILVFVFLCTASLCHAASAPPWIDQRKIEQIASGLKVLAFPVTQKAVLDLIGPPESQELLPRVVSRSTERGADAPYYMDVMLTDPRASGGHFTLRLYFTKKEVVGNWGDAPVVIRTEIELAIPKGAIDADGQCLQGWRYWILRNQELNSEGSAAPQRAAGPRLNKPGSSED